MTLLLLRLALLFAAAQTRGAWGVAYAPEDARTRRPAIVVLHGMWAGPEEQCPAFESAATRFGFLVCPRGNAPFGEGRMWAGTYADAARPIHAALDAAEALAPGKLDRSHDGTLIGYSNGAYFAAEVACAERGRWQGLVLLSMKVDLNAARLRAAGVRRVVLAAGERDDARPSMEATARSLTAAGFDGRFMSLGPGGHPLPADLGPRMCEAIAWVRGVDTATCNSGATPASP